MASDVIRDIIDKIKNMTVMEVADLQKQLKEELGLPDIAPAVAIPVAAGEQSQAVAEEKSEYKVTLSAIGGEKIKVIKALRSVTALNIGDAKKAVESAPFVITESALKEEAEKMKKTLEDAGAKIELS